MHLCESIFELEASILAILDWLLISIDRDYLPSLVVFLGVFVSVAKKLSERFMVLDYYLLGFILIPCLGIEKAFHFCFCRYMRVII